MRPEKPSDLFLKVGGWNFDKVTHGDGDDEDDDDGGPGRPCRSVEYSHHAFFILYYQP